MVLLVAPGGVSAQPYGSAARAYHAAGYSPLWLPPRKKASPPLGYTGRDGREASTEDVDRWTAEQGAGNICLRLPRGVAGVDVDAYKDDLHAAAWGELAARCGPLPDAPWCTSRDDGVSGIRLFRVPLDWEGAGKLPEGSNGQSPGEVIQWHHRYVVCPPSIHPEGRVYQWRSGSVTSVADLPALPQSWLDALSLAAVPPQPARPAPAQRTAEAAGGRPGDEFNERADWLADILGPHGWTVHHETSGTLYVTRPGKSRRDGHSATIGHSGDGVERLYVFSADAAPFEMEVPYTKFAAWALLNHGGDWQAAARELGRTGYGTRPAPAARGAASEVPWPSGPGRERHLSAVTAGDGGDDDDDEPAPHSWRRVDLSAVLDGTWKAPEPTVGDRDDGRGLFYAGRMHAVAAEAESGKTWFGLVAVATELTRGQSCVYLDFEDDEGGICGRLLTMGIDAGVIGARFGYIRPEHPLGQVAAFDLAEAMGDLKPSLVILDGVTEAMSLHGLELKDNTDVAKFWQLLPRRLARTGAAVVLLDHVVKDRESRAGYAIGGVHKLNGLNGAMYLMENREPFGIGRTGRSRVLLRKDRPGQLRRYGVPAQDNLFWYCDLVVDSHGEDFAEVSLPAPQARGAVAPVRPTAIMAKVAAALDGSAIGLSGNAIEGAVGGRHDVVRYALELLINDGYVVVEKQGAAKIHKLMKPFRDD